MARKAEKPLNNLVRISLPLIQATHTNITAAVVGVVLNLALVFATTVIWPQGFAAGLDWLAITLSIVASVLLLSHMLEVW